MGNGTGRDRSPPTTRQALENTLLLIPEALPLSPLDHAPQDPVPEPLRPPPPRPYHVIATTNQQVNRRILRSQSLPIMQADSVDFVRLCHLDEIEPFTSKLMQVGGRMVALFRRQGTNLYALDNACYHHGGPLVNGDIEDLGGHLCVVCPWHGYPITLAEGEGLYLDLNREVRTKGSKQRRHRIKVEAEEVWIQLSLLGERESDAYAHWAPQIVSQTPGNEPTDTRPSVASPQKVEKRSRWPEGTPKSRGFLAEVLDSVRETGRLVTFSLRPVQGVVPPYHAGQHATFEFCIAGSIYTRTYTISTAPSVSSEDTTFDISVKLKEGGVVSSWLHSNLIPGSQVKVKGFGGDFTPFLLTPLPKQYVMIAGGIGITPIISIIRALKDFSSSMLLSLDVVVFYSERHPDDFAFSHILAVEDVPGLVVYYTLTGPPPEDGSWTGLTGRISGELIHSKVRDLNQRHSYLCGPEGFIDNLNAQMLSLGFPPSNAHIERFNF